MSVIQDRPSERARRIKPQSASHDPEPAVEVFEAASIARPIDAPTTTFTWVDADGTVAQIETPAGKIRSDDPAGSHSSETSPAVFYLPPPRWLPPDPLYVPETADVLEAAPVGSHDSAAVAAILPEPTVDVQPQTVAEVVQAQVLASALETIESQPILEMDALGVAEFLQLESIEPARQPTSPLPVAKPIAMRPASDRGKRVLIALLITAFVWAYLRRARLLP